MQARIPIWFLVAHAVGVGVPGLLLFLFPRELGAHWPWELPPLAARFVGGSFAAIAVAALVTTRSPAGIVGMALMGIGQMLVPLCGWLTLEDVTSPGGLVALTIVLSAIAVGYVRILLDKRLSPTGPPLERWLRSWFAIHMVVVGLVGLTMYGVPSQASGLWPWSMPLIDVRLLGSIFLASSLLSAWAVPRRRGRTEVDPLLAAYAGFASLALVASLLHLGLFDPHRVVTWVFFVLYVAVAVGGWVAIATRRRALDALPT